MVSKGGRRVIDTAQAAYRGVVSPATVRRRLHRAGVHAVNGPSHSTVVTRRPRPELWDEHQVNAALAGTVVPSLPEGESPDDLLDRVETADALGITLISFDQAWREDRLPHLRHPTVLRGVSHWRRADVDAQRADPPRPGGRPRGESVSPRQRVVDEWERQQHSGRTPTLTELAATVGVNRQTVRAALRQVGAHPQDEASTPTLKEDE